MESGGLDLNVLDAVLLVLLLYVSVRGWRLGAVSQVTAFGGLALGLLVGVWAAPRIAGLFVDGPGPGGAFLTLAVLLVAALVGQGIGVGIGMRLHRAVHGLGVGVADRVAGVGIGALGFLLVVWLLSGALAQGPFTGLAQQVRNSQVVRALDDALPPPPDVVGRIATYLDEQGFPQVFAGPGRAITAQPAPPAADEAVRAAAAAGRPSTVQIRALGCGTTIGAGSGFVTRPGFIVTNAHVIAGFDQLRVRDAAGEHAAVAIHFDPALDIAVLSAPGVSAPAIGWTDTPATRGSEGSTLGFPGGQSQMVVRPATVQGRMEAVGRDIYGEGSVRREILVLTAAVERGDSGGPFVTSDGLVGGVVFAADPGENGTGYALTAEQVRPGVEGAIARTQEVGVGACRF
ncbi:MarP family serine protease [Pseudonocardia bannensis]|uniref:MarP family serine protease n=1 Tax=Pseudonocardia bannensis TaxID=630973 RepID=A0A848DCP5_9PSEU|nr:MarP family serine protease [Pseudonocardia bannensis]NMH90378.1 MarP family serine protease [Pseudonocardia bannensis]